MEAYFIYLLEVSACLAVLFLFYKVFLTNLTFYRARRFFLIFSVLLSFLIPSLDVKINNFSSAVQPFVYKNTEVNPPVEKTNNALQQTSVSVPNVPEEAELSASSLDLKALLFLVYWAGFIFLSAKLLFGIVKLRRGIKRSKMMCLNGNTVYLQETEVPAFSFFRYIFINPSLLDSDKEVASVVEHELVHAKEGHSYDLFFFEIAKIVLWFNPFIYFAKKEAEKVHEFLADRKSSEITGKHFYSHILLKHAQPVRQPSLMHSFAAMPLKSRIKELFKMKSSKAQIMKFAFLLPVLFGLFLVFSCSHEFDNNNVIFPNGKKVKSIKVVYHDEYGDMPQYDGQYYSWATYDKSGKLVGFKKGTLKESINDEFAVVINGLTYPFMHDKIVWYLDYQSYDHFIALLFEYPNIFAKAKMESVLRLQKFDSPLQYDITKNSMGMPLEISTIYPNSGFRPFPEGTDVERFQYDEENRLVEWTHSRDLQLGPNGEKIKNTNRRAVEYNASGKVAKVIADEMVFQLVYDDKENISEVNIGTIKYTYSYDEHGIRTKSFAYNPNGELEYSLDYEYEFF